MLASNVLKLRLDRIEQQGQHLSVKDQLKLVTLLQPELTAGYTSLLHFSLPKRWHFHHHTAEEISHSLRLINLINQVFIPAYPHYAERYHWFEQGLAFTLQYTEHNFTQSQLSKDILPQLAQAKDSALKLSILKQLQDDYTEPEIKSLLAHTYMQLQDWSAAIESYQMLFQQQPIQPESVHYAYVRCLLNRNHDAHEQESSDAVEALESLLQLNAVQHLEQHEELLNQAVSLLLPKSLRASKVSTPLIDLQHKLQFVGYSLNHWLVSSDFTVPYYKNLVEAAPKLLDPHEIIVSLDRHRAANAALQNILIDRDLKLVSGASASSYSLGFIWNYLQINPLVLDALVAASNGNPDAFYNLKQIADPDGQHAAALTRISAYLAKQQVAYNLSQQGHTIEFAEYSGLAGFDLIVDGTPMQVKCSLAADDIEKFAQKYPHVAIIVNIELAHLQEKYASVFVDLALSYESVQRTAQASLHYMAEPSDFLPIPLMNTGFAVYRNFKQGQSKKFSRPPIAYRQTDSLIKNGLAMGAAIGGAVSGSMSALIVGSVALYRSWRIQKIEQTKSAQEKELLALQCHKVTALLIDFAEWFSENLLKYRVDFYAYQLRQIETKLIGKIPEAVISTTLFAYKFESHQRAQQLYDWMQKQLIHEQPRQRVQAGWVAVAQASQFMSVELKQRLAQLQQELDQYKHLSHQTVPFSLMTKQAATSFAQPVFKQTMQYEVSPRFNH